MRDFVAISQAEAALMTMTLDQRVNEKQQKKQERIGEERSGRATFLVKTGLRGKRALEKYAARPAGPLSKENLTLGR
jgi:hypothetical protein